MSKTIDQLAKEHLSHVDIRDKWLATSSPDRFGIVSGEWVEVFEIEATTEQLQAFASAYQAHQWISVKDRLPEQFTECWVLNGSGNVYHDKYKSESVYDGWETVNKVTHWMPCNKPAAPESEGK